MTALVSTVAATVRVTTTYKWRPGGKGSQEVDPERPPPAMPISGKVGSADCSKVLWSYERYADSVEDSMILVVLAHTVEPGVIR